MSSLASGIGFSLVGVMGHACVLEAAISRSAVSEFHALGALSIATRGVELLRGAGRQEHSDE